MRNFLGSPALHETRYVDYTVSLMLRHRLRRWPVIKPALGQRLVLAGLLRTPPLLMMTNECCATRPHTCTRGVICSVSRQTHMDQVMKHPFNVPQGTFISKKSTRSVWVCVHTVFYSAYQSLLFLYLIEGGNCYRPAANKTKIITRNISRASDLFRKHDPQLLSLT